MDCFDQITTKSFARNVLAASPLASCEAAIACRVESSVDWSSGCHWPPTGLGPVFCDGAVSPE